MELICFKFSGTTESNDPPLQSWATSKTTRKGRASERAGGTEHPTNSDRQRAAAAIAIAIAIPTPHPTGIEGTPHSRPNYQTPRSPSSSSFSVSLLPYYHTHKQPKEPTNQPTKGVTGRGKALHTSFFFDFLFLLPSSCDGVQRGDGGDSGDALGGPLPVRGVQPGALRRKRRPPPPLLLPPAAPGPPRPLPLLLLLPPLPILILLLPPLPPLLLFFFVFFFFFFFVLFFVLLGRLGGGGGSCRGGGGGLLLRSSPLGLSLFPSCCTAFPLLLFLFNGKLFKAVILFEH